MPSLLVAGVPRAVAEWLGRELPGTTVTAAGTGAETVQALVAAAYDVVLLDHSLKDPSALHILEAIQKHARPRPAVLFALRGAPDSDYLSRLAELGVRRIMVHPLDPQDLLARLSDYLPQTARPQAPDALAELSRLWDRHQPLHLQRVEVLARAARQAELGRLDPDLRLEAAAEAHKLAGVLGTFGLPEGTEAGREAELLLNSADPPADWGLRLSRLALRLEGQIRRGPPRPDEGPAVEESSVLWVGADREAALHVREVLPLRILADATEAQAALHRAHPDVVILDLDGGGSPEDLLDFLSSLAHREPPVPVLVLASETSASRRMDATLRGASGIMGRDAPREAVAEAVERLRERPAESTPRILALDDDPALLETLQHLLEPAGFQVVGVENPLAFWAALEEHQPDLLVLDLEMPYLSGLDLCRMLRRDLRWGHLPVVILTKRTEPGIVQRVFTAGADDYVAKPIVGPELVARLRTRYERARASRPSLHQATGLATREAAMHDLRLLLRLAEWGHSPMALGALRVEGDERDIMAAGRTLRRLLRPADLAAAWSRREWLVAAFGQSAAELREALQDFPAAAAPARVRLGTAEYGTDGTTLRQLLAEARLRVLDPSGATCRVDLMIVDDDEAMADLLQQTFSARGLSVHVVNDGALALKALQGDPPRLVPRLLLLDVELPGLSGLELLRRLGRESLTQMKVLMLTRRRSERATLNALEGWNVDYLAKPFGLPVLTQKVDQALGG